MKDQEPNIIEQLAEISLKVETLESESRAARERIAKARAELRDGKTSMRRELENLNPVQGSAA